MNATNLQKLYPIKQGAFELHDYSRKDLTATITVDGFEDTDQVELSQDDILSAALAYRWIASFYDPDIEGGNYHVEDTDGHMMTFRYWWESVAGTDADKLFEGAIAVKAEDALKQAARTMFLDQKSVAA